MSKNKIAASTVYFTIGQAASMLGISASSLRNWERMGLVVPVRSQGRYRLYSREILQAAQQIKYLRKVKRVNLAGILAMQKPANDSRGTPAKIQHSSSIGGRLSVLRHQQRLTLAEVAQKTGLSISFLSAVEHGQANASIATLQKLAHLYKTNVLSFFGNDYNRRRLVKPGVRKALQPHPGLKIELLAHGRNVMDPNLYRIAPGVTSGGSYHHEGEEFIYMLQGKLEIWLDEVERYVLDPGDSLYFESTHAHRWRNLSDKETLFLWINTPPTF